MKQNSIPSAVAAADSSTTAQVTKSSHNSSKPPVVRRFLFQYRSMGKDLMVYLDGSSLNDVMVLFATRYNFIDEVYEIAEVR